MAFMTLKKYLFDDQVELRRVMSIMFKGIAANAVQVEAGGTARLQAQMEAIEATLKEEFTSEHLLVAAGAAMQTLEGHNQRTTQFITRQGAELQKIIAMLAESVMRIGGSSQRSVQVLAEIKAHLEHATGLEDLHEVKGRLGICLEQVCSESARRQSEAESAIAELQSHIVRAEAHAKLPPDFDPVTELPGRAAADLALREALAGPGRKYVGVLVLDRLQSINARFGSSIGDRVLAELARHIAAGLSAGDTLFRLAGPTLLAVMPRQCSIDRMRIDLKPVFSKPLEKEFNVGGRDVLIPVSAAWTIFALVPPLDTILKHVDAFVASQIPKDYL